MGGNDADEVTTEEVAAEDVVAEEVTIEEVTTEDEAAAEDVAAEEVIIEEVTPEDEAPEDVVAEEVTIEEVTPEDEAAAEDVAAEVCRLYGAKGEKAVLAANAGRVIQYRDFCVVIGTTGTYVVDDTFCTCGDFTYRGLQCWHILALRTAKALGTVVKRDEWYQDLI